MACGTCIGLRHDLKAAVAAGHVVDAARILAAGTRHMARQIAGQAGAQLPKGPPPVVAASRRVVR